MKFCENQFNKRETYFLRFNSVIFNPYFPSQTLVTGSFRHKINLIT